MRQLKRSKLALRGLLIGIALGDGYITQVNSRQNSAIFFGHSIKQKHYCFDKLKLISDLLRINFNSNQYFIYNKKTNKYYPIYQGKTNTHRYLTKFRKLLYKDNKKIITKKILDYLTLEGLAYWYMDDGGIISYHKRKKIWGIFLNTQNFSYDENILIKNYFKEKLGIEARVGKHSKGKFRLVMNKTQSIIFLNLIDEYKHENLNYKFCLNYDEYVKKFNKINTQEVEPQGAYNVSLVN